MSRVDDKMDPVLYSDFAKVCDQRDAACAYALELREALKAIARYGSDTLSGRTDGPDDRDWQREGVLEMTRRAQAALAKNPAPTMAFSQVSDPTNWNAQSSSDDAVTGHIPPMALPAMKAAAIEIIQKLDALAVRHDSYEYGLPMYDDGVMAELTLAVIEILHQHSSWPVTKETK